MIRANHKRVILVPVDKSAPRAGCGGNAESGKNRTMDSTPALFSLPDPGSPQSWEPGEVQALRTLAHAPLSLLHPEWAAALLPQEETLKGLGEMLLHEYDAGTGFLPQPSRVLRALSKPLSEVRVLIVGQDPYPTVGHAVGLSFSVDKATRPLPRSLGNIYKELEWDLGIPPAPHGDLSAWEDQGVLLLNRVLTVTPGATGSHRRRGWENVTDAVIAALVARKLPLVSLLWGNDAAKLAPQLGETAVIESAHPSPLSASRGFFGSRPFSRVNELLVAQGAPAIDWRVTRN